MFDDSLEDGNEIVKQKEIKINKHISDDLLVLQQHYTLLLEYVCTLEKDIEVLRNDKAILKRKMSSLEERLEKYEKGNEEKL